MAAEPQRDLRADVDLARVRAAEQLARLRLGLPRRRHQPLVELQVLPGRGRLDEHHEHAPVVGEVVPARQIDLQRALGLPTPAYRHHFLLLEEHGGKLAKLHGAVGWRELRGAASAGETCALLARIAGLYAGDAPIAPAALRDGFAWERVERRDQVLRWTGHALERLGPAPPQAEG